MIVVEDVHRIHRGSGASVYYNNCAGDVPGENVPNVGCSGSEPAGKVKRMVGKPFTSTMEALVCLVTIQVFRLKDEV